MILEEYNSLIYVIVAIVGMIYYQYQSWKANGELFDLGKVIDTLWSGGIVSMITSAFLLSKAGLNFSDEAAIITTLTALLAAFALAGGIDTAQNKTLKVLAKRKAQKVLETVNIEQDKILTVTTEDSFPPDTPVSIPDK